MISVNLFSFIVVVLYVVGPCGCAPLFNCGKQNTIPISTKTPKRLNENQKSEKEMIGKYVLRSEIIILIFN